ncbi:acyl dehydratase [Streptomyces sp. NPDC055078]
MTGRLDVGDEFPALVHIPTPLQLFRYSAVTWNSHRIHYEDRHAHHEGHAGVLTHSHLRAALALRCITEFLGTDWRLEHVSYRVRKTATAGLELTYGARVTERSGDTATLDIRETHPDGTVGVEGTAVVRRTEEKVNR